MSTDRTLDEFQSTSTPEDDTEAADHGRPNWNPDGTPRCACGDTVSRDVARVFGDNTDTVPACAACHTPDVGAPHDQYTSDARALVNYLGGDV